MGKISKVFYREIDPEVCPVEEAAKFYYYYNLAPFHELFQKEYEEYELNQIRLRNSIIADIVKNKKSKARPKVGSSVLALSSIKNKVVLISDIM